MSHLLTSEYVLQLLLHIGLSILFYYFNLFQVLILLLRVGWLAADDSAVTWRLRLMAGG
jgi:hypothetical protein